MVGDLYKRAFLAVLQISGVCFQYKYNDDADTLSLYVRYVF